MCRGTLQPPPPPQGAPLRAPLPPQEGAAPPSESAAWEAAQVRLAVEALHPDERQVARLQHLEGYTHQEISDMLGLPLGTVKSRSFRAHRSLATRLAHLRTDDV